MSEYGAPLNQHNESREMVAVVSALRSALVRLEEVVSSYGNTKKGQLASVPYDSLQKLSPNANIIKQSIGRNVESKEELDLAWPLEISYGGVDMVIIPVWDSSPVDTYQEYRHDNPSTEEALVGYDVWISGELRGTTSRVTDAIKMGLGSVPRRNE